MKSAISFRIITILVMLLGSLSSVFAADRFYLDPVIIRAGESMSLAFKLDNSLEYFGFQADISLPQGLDIVKNIEGKPECFLSDRAYDYSIVSNLVSESLLRVGAFSNKHTAISGSSGTLLFINVNATNSFVGGVLTINNVMFTQSDNKDIVFSGTTVEIQKYVSVENITLNEESATLKVGDSVQLSATIQPDNATDKSIVWTSSDESVASVTNDGMVTALKVGETVITAKSTDGSDISASCKVNVVTTLVTSILIDKSEWSGKVGDTILLTATVQPEDATDKSIIWTSSDESVASVTNEGLVTAVKVGEAVITAKSTDGSVVSALCKISVLPTLVTSISIDRSEWSGKVGDTIQLTATMQPEDATDKSIVWTSSDESVASVTYEGLVTAIKIGEAVITATSTDGSDISASCKVNVIPTPVASILIDKSEWSGKVGDTILLTATVQPEDATDKSIIWTSSDESVASVTNEGLVTAVKVGEAVITAKSTDGSVVSALCKISVLPTLVTSISIDRSEWSGKVGDTIRLTATVQPEDATDKSIVWTSSDESVTTVTNEGIVTAVKVGETVITATSTDGSGISASCNITVLPILVESISISPEIWNGIEGESFQLNVTILPEDATNKTVSYSSSDDSVAQVDHEGLVSVLNVGNCKIMVSTLDGSNLTAECIITSSSGIDEIFIDGETSWNVYDLNGAVLKNNCDKEALKLLSSGIYILQSGDKTIKIIIR